MLNEINQKEKAQTWTFSVIRGIQTDKTMNEMIFKGNKLLHSGNRTEITSPTGVGTGRTRRNGKFGKTYTVLWKEMEG